MAKKIHLEGIKLRDFGISSKPMGRESYGSKEAYEKAIDEYVDSAKGYINAVYRENKEVLDSVIGGQSPRNVLKREIKEFVKKGKTVKQAAETFFRGTNFLEPSERFKQNLLKSLKTFPEAKKELKEIFSTATDAEGNKIFTSDRIYKNKLRWDKENKRYIYDNKIVMEYQSIRRGRSPVALNVRIAKEGEFN